MKKDEANSPIRSRKRLARAEMSPQIFGLSLPEASHLVPRAQRREMQKGAASETMALKGPFHLPERVRERGKGTAAAAYMSRRVLTARGAPVVRPIRELLARDWCLLLQGGINCRWSGILGMLSAFSR